MHWAAMATPSIQYNTQIRSMVAHHYLQTTSTLRCSHGGTREHLFLVIRIMGMNSIVFMTIMRMEVDSTPPFPCNSTPHGFMQSAPCLRRTVISIKDVIRGKPDCLQSRRISIPATLLQTLTPWLMEPGGSMSKS